MNLGHDPDLNLNAYLVTTLLRIQGVPNSLGVLNLLMILN